MYDQTAMREIYGGADLPEQAKPLRDVELLRSAVFVEWNALDVLHHEVGKSIGRGAAIHQPCDVWMIERREDLPFVAKSFEDAGRSRVIDDLQRAPLPILVVGALDKKDGAHSAVADLTNYAIRADARAYARGHRPRGFI